MLFEAAALQTMFFIFMSLTEFQFRYLRFTFGKKKKKNLTYFAHLFVPLVFIAVTVGAGWLVEASALYL